MEKRVIFIDISPDIQNEYSETAGVMWEHNATQLEFNIPPSYIGDYRYYIEYRSILGTKVRTEYLELDTETNTVTYDIPVTMSSLKGVECYFNIVRINDDGDTIQVIKPRKFCLSFDFSPDTDNYLAKTNDFSINSLIEAIRLGTFKGDKGDKGDQGIKGDKGDRGEGMNTVVVTGKNLIKNVIYGEAVKGTGVFAEMADYCRTDYMYLPKGTYAYSTAENSYGAFRYALYTTDESRTHEGTFIGAQYRVFTLTEPKYVVLCDLSSKTHLQLEVGDVSTEYEDYYEKIRDDLLVDAYKASDEAFEVAEEAKNTADNAEKTVESLFGVGRNIYDASLVTAGWCLDTKSKVGGESLLAVNEEHGVSSWIKVQENETYIFSYVGINNTIRIHLADENGILVAAPTTATNTKTITIPAGCTQMRISTVLTTLKSSELQLEKGTAVTSYRPYNSFIKNKILDNYSLFGKTAVFNGDSILGLPYNWGKQLCDHYEMNCINYAIGGSTLSVWGNNGNEPRDRAPVIERYTEMTDEADIVVISIGTNDWRYSWAPMGEDLSVTPNQEEIESAKKTFKGSLHLLIRGLNEKYPDKKIIFCTPIKRNDSPVSTMNIINNFNLTLADYAEAIKNVCGQYGIHVIDMFNECPLNPAFDNQQSMYFDGSRNVDVGYKNLYNDRTHPNYFGAKIQARCAMEYFKNIFIE